MRSKLEIKKHTAFQDKLVDDYIEIKYEFKGYTSQLEAEFLKIERELLSYDRK